MPTHNAAAHDLGAPNYIVSCIKSFSLNNVSIWLICCTLSKATRAACFALLPPGARTSFKLVTGVKLSQATARSKEGLPQEFADAVFCDKWDYRVEAAARTWQRPHAMDNLM